MATLVAFLDLGLVEGSISAGIEVSRDASLVTTIALHLEPGAAEARLGFLFHNALNTLS